MYQSLLIKTQGHEDMNNDCGGLYCIEIHIYLKHKTPEFSFRGYLGIRNVHFRVMETLHTPFGVTYIVKQDILYWILQAPLLM